MPLRGESVGTAYVRILADGSDLDDSIRDEFNKTEPFMEAQGKRSAKAYQEGFEAHMKSAPTRREMEDAISDSLARGDAIKAFLSSAKWKESERRLVARWGEVGQRMGANLANNLIETGDFDAFRRSFDNLIRESSEAVKEIQALEKEADAERERELAATLKRQKAAILQMHKEIASGIKTTTLAQNQALKDLVRETDNIASNVRTNMRITEALVSEVQGDIAEFDRIERERDKETKQREIEQRKRIRDIAEQFDLLRERVEHYSRGVDKSRASRKRFLADLVEIRKAMKAAGGETEKFVLHADDIDRTLRRSNPTFDNFSNRMGLIGQRVGRLFGRGSRNDLLNFFGVFIGGLASLPGLVTKAFSGILNFGRKIGDSFTGAGGGVKGLAAAFLTLIGPIAAVAVGLFGLFLIVGPLGAGISLLTGAIIALAGSLAFGLAAALAAVAGALVPLIAGFGVFAAVLIAKRDELGDLFKPLLDDLKELGNVAAEPIFKALEDGIKGLGPVIESLEPLAEKVGKAIGTSITGFIDGLKGPEFKRFTNFLEQVLPGMIRKIGRIFENVFGGLGGLFRALTPITNEFLRWLEKITGEFSDWINSKDGQKEMRDFLERAADSAKSIGDFLGEAVGALGDLLSAGKGTGDNIFETMTDKLEEFRDFLKEAAEDGTLQQWFDDAKQFADDIGGVLVELGKLIGALDEPETREELFAILDAIKDIAEALQEVSDIASDIAEFFFAWGASMDAITGKLKPLDKDMETNGDNAKKWNIILTGVTRGISRRIAEMVVDVIGEIRRMVLFFPTAIAGMAGRIQSGLASIAARFLQFRSTVAQRLGEVIAEIRGLPARIIAQADRWLEAGRALGNAILNGIRAAASQAGGVVTSIANAAWERIRDLINNAIRLINTNIPNSLGRGPLSIDIPDNPIPYLARGGVFDRAQVALIGEAGREAVVPLDRPLSQVDPSVRELAAFARGMGGGGGKGVDASGWTIITPTTDSRAVAEEILGRLNVASYA